MGKKKQADFQKTKLRVGRILPKGKNVTSTAFKSKKIILPQQKLANPNSDKTNLQEQFNLANHHNSTTKMSALNTICNSIQEDLSFVTDLSTVLETAFKAVSDIEVGVRKASLKLLKTTLNLITDSQMESFINLTVSNLRCAMTHSDISIRQMALEILDIVLATHAKQLSNFPALLLCILDMISCKSINKAQGQRKSHRRTLPPVYDENIKSQEWRMNVLKRFEHLLRVVLENMNPMKRETDDENVVHWNGQEALFIQLYYGGGLKPAELDPKEMFFTSNDSRAWSPDGLKNFIDELIPILMDIYAEEISEFIAHSNECYLPDTVAENIHIIAQIFCHLGEWVKILAEVNEKLEPWFNDKFSHVCDSLMKGFPYHLKSKSPYKKIDCNPVIVKLNLALCYLCSGFVVERNCTQKQRCDIVKYLNKIFTMKHDIQYSIPLLLKIAKCWLHSDYFEKPIVVGYLLGLCEIIKISDNRANQSILINFFIEIVMDTTYLDFVSSQEMKTFFTLLLKELKKMHDSDVIDKKLLKAIRSVCALGLRTFRKSLSSISPKNFAHYLKYDDADFQETAAFLLCHTKPFDVKYLYDICEVLNDPSFPYRATYYIIDSLSHRFCKNVASANRVSFIKFLVNVACDSLAISDEKWEDFEDEINFHDNWTVVEDIAPYKIYPSDFWKTHSRKFQLCLDALALFPEKECIHCLYHFAHQILVNNSSFPVHTIIALWKLIRIYNLPESRQLSASINSLMLSCMLYCSMLVQNCNSDEFFICATEELTNSLGLDIDANVFKLVRQMESESEKIRHIEGVGHLLKIINFLITKTYLHSEQRRVVIPLLDNLEKMHGPDLHLRPLWGYICDYFTYEQCASE